MRRATAVTRALVLVLVASFLLGQAGCKKQIPTDTQCDGSESGCDR